MAKISWQYRLFLNWTVSQPYFKCSISVIFNIIISMSLHVSWQPERETKWNFVKSSLYKIFSTGLFSKDFMTYTNACQIIFSVKYSLSHKLKKKFKPLFMNITQQYYFSCSCVGKHYWYKSYLVDCYCCKWKLLSSFEK